MPSINSKLRVILKAPSGIYNIGTGKLISVIEICRLIEKEFFNNSKFTDSINSNNNIDYKTGSFANTTKIKKNLKISSFTEIEKGIREYIECITKGN